MEDDTDCIVEKPDLQNMRNFFDIYGGTSEFEVSAVLGKIIYRLKIFLKIIISFN